MNKKLKSIPKFRSEAEERRFWETHDSGDYIDWSKAELVRFPNLKPSMTAISLRLPVALLECIKVAANKRDVFYQSLIQNLGCRENKNRPEQVRLISRSSALAVSATLMRERQESARDQSRSGIGPPRAVTHPRSCYRYRT